MYKSHDRYETSLDYAGGPDVPCNRKSPIRRGEDLEAAYTVRKQTEQYDEVTSSGAGGVSLMRLEDRIEGSVTGIGPGPEGSSPTVASRRSEGGGAEELFGHPVQGYECPLFVCPVPYL